MMCPFKRNFVSNLNKRISSLDETKIKSLPLDATGNNAADEPSLRKHVNQQNGQHGDDRTRHDHIPLSQGAGSSL